MKLKITSQGKILAAINEVDEPDYSILTGFNFFSLIEEKDVVAVRQYIGRVLNEPEISSCRFRMIFQKSSIDCVCFAIAAADRQTIELSLHEIPSDEQVQRRLAEAQGRLRSFLNQMPVAVLIVGNNAIIQAVNPTSEKLFGLKGPEFLSMQVYDLFDFERMKTERPDSVTKLISEPQTMARMIGKRKVGHRTITFPLELTIGTLDSATGLLVLSISDISEREAHEKMKQEFIAMVSHDLTAPLTCLSAGIGMLRHLDVDPGSEVGKETLRELEAESDKLVRFIKDLLDVTRLESGRFVLEKGPAALQSIFQGAARSLKFMAEDRRVDIVVLETDLQVLADKERLEQVVTNLLSNAIKASIPDSQPILIECSELDEYVEVRIKDHGCGLSREDQERVFDKFVRVDEKGQPGTGLGLSICKAIIEQHGGDIGVESVLGKGTTFWFRVLRAK